jgi:hypothetical protein
MKLEDRFEIKGRGSVFTTRIDGAPPVTNGRVRRLRDGVEWTVKGIESFLRMRGLRLGDPIGLLLEGESQPEVGDEIEAVEPAWVTPESLRKLATFLLEHIALPVEPTEAQLRQIAGLVESEINVTRNSDVASYALQSIVMSVCGNDGRWTEPLGRTASWLRALAKIRGEV